LPIFYFLLFPAGVGGQRSLRKAKRIRDAVMFPFTRRVPSHPPPPPVLRPPFFLFEPFWSRGSRFTINRSHGSLCSTVPGRATFFSKFMLSYHETRSARALRYFLAPVFPHKLHRCPFLARFFTPVGVSPGWTKHGFFAQILVLFGRSSLYIFAYHRGRFPILV